MDYPFGRNVLYVVPDAAATRVFKCKDAALAAAAAGQVYEFAETHGASEYFLAYVHDRDGRETRVMDMASTDQGTVARRFPDVTALRFGRYGDLEAFERDLEEFYAFWERVRDAGGVERRFLDALMDVGRRLARDAGGYVAVDELERCFAGSPC